MSETETRTIVVPCYNEGARLSEQAFLDALQSQPRLRLIFVDDGSADATQQLLEAIVGKAGERASVIVLPENQGKAAAVRAGILAAVEQQAPLFGYWDADLSTPLEYVERFASELSRPDRVMVFGSRVRLLGSDIRREAFRHYVGRCFATVAALALELPVYDTQCGAKLFRNCEATRRVFAAPFETRWAFDVELFARLVALGRERGTLDVERACVEFPLERWSEVGGSKLSVTDAPLIARELFIAARTARGPSKWSGG